jgi:hypothetical protein
MPDQEGTLQTRQMPWNLIFLMFLVFCLLNLRSENTSAMSGHIFNSGLVIVIVGLGIVKSSYTPTPWSRRIAARIVKPLN